MIQNVAPQQPITTQIKKATQIAADVLNTLSDIEAENAHAEQIRLLAKALVQLSEARTLVHAELNNFNETNSDVLLQ
jgi:hypothetical protein